MKELTKHYLISGRVQGVGYREFTRSRARRLQLQGWVRNLQDGRVEAVVRGPEEALTTLQDQLLEGPPSARIDSLQCREWSPPRAELEFTPEFEVRKDGHQPCSES